MRPRRTCSGTTPPGRACNAVLIEHFTDPANLDHALNCMDGADRSQLAEALRVASPDDDAPNRPARVTRSRPCPTDEMRDAGSGFHDPSSPQVRVAAEQVVDQITDGANDIDSARTSGDTIDG